MKNFFFGEGGFLGYILKFYWALWATLKNFSWALWAALESEIGAFVVRNIGNAEFGGKQFSSNWVLSKFFRFQQMSSRLLPKSGPANGKSKRNVRK